MFSREVIIKTALCAVIFFSCKFHHAMEKQIISCDSFKETIEKIIPCSIHGKDILLVKTKYKRYSLNYDGPGYNAQLSEQSTIKSIQKKGNKGESLFIIDVKTGLTIQEITAKQIADVLCKKDESLTERLYHGFSIKIIGDQECPLITFTLKNFRTKSVQYNLENEQLYVIDLEKEKQTSKRKDSCEIYANKSYLSPKNPILSCNNYNVMQQYKSLKIIHNISKLQANIPLEDHLYHIFARTRYVLLHNVEMRKRDIYSLFRNNLVLYDSQTGKKLKCLDLETLYPFMWGKHFKDAIFGKNDDFVLLIYKDIIVLYDLHKLEPTSYYSFDETPTLQPTLSYSNAYIVVPTKNTIQICKNPLKVFEEQDELERINYLTQEHCTKENNQNYIKITVNKNITIETYKSFL